MSLYFDLLDTQNIAYTHYNLNFCVIFRKGYTPVSWGIDIW